MIPEKNIENITGILSQIPDPEIPIITIGDLGILRSVKWDGDSYIVTITPTYSACPAMAMVEAQIKEKMQKLGHMNVAVDTVYTPVWTTDWLSEETKKKLKHYGIAPPPHSSCVKVLNDLTKIPCPFCSSIHTELISRFGSTPCKAMYKCKNCQEPFEHFKCH
ncbi:MAG TPA: 1,2-phenylacetyl-CoA epoxidase subunit PaaD [Bacteroidia bacterium]|jgi:ring-1,2-phenylacetyl-CoA epoxidase subunit PaaD|nr:1,2-phenylacetyl-CoA epoxidase subunit PaaD [Bacteroidia bacterium]